MVDITRRDLLALTAVAGVAAAALPRRAGADEAVFRHGVASGDPIPNSVVLWTRVSGFVGPAIVEWEVATDTGFAQVAARGTVSTDASRDYTVHVDPLSLNPATTYYYRFHAGGQTSPVGTTRTAPAPGAALDHLNVAVCSCASWAAGYFSAYADIARRARHGDIDLVVHLGDYIYEYGPGKHGKVRLVDPPWETTTLADYRRRYAQYRSDPDLQAAHQAAPWVLTWDDHEILDNATRYGALAHNRALMPWEHRRAGAMQAYFEWQPIRASNPHLGGRLYRGLTFGNLLQLSMLDLRSYRDYKNVLVGDEQYNWLVDEVQQADTAWHVLGNSVMLAKLTFADFPKEVRDAVRRTFHREPAPNPDQWDGFPRERDRILRLFAKKKNAVFLTGDIHSEWYSTVRLGSTAVGVEMVGTSITAPNVNDYLHLPEGNPLSVAGAETVRRIQPHFQHVNLDAHGYSIVRFTHGHVDLTWLRVADITVPGSKVQEAVSFRHTIDAL